MIRHYDITALGRRAMLPQGASFKRWWLVLLLFVLFSRDGRASTSAPHDIKLEEFPREDEDRGFSSPLYVYSVFFYDTEYRAGIGQSSRNPIFSCRYGKEDGTVVEVSNQLTPGDNTAPNFGLPFWWEFKTPWNGRVMGWTTTRRYPDRIFYCIPVPGSEAGMTLDNGPNGGPSAGVLIVPSLVDKLNTPSPLAIYEMANLPIESTLTAVYLPGNLISSSVGIESHNYNFMDLSFSGPLVLWGDYGTVYPENAPFSRVMPFGPILLALTFDGSTTGMLEMNLTNYDYLQTHLPFAPLPGSSLPTATEALQIPDPPDWITDVFYEAALLGDSVDLTTDVDKYCDRNGDGIIDVADQFAFNVLEGERGAAPRLLRNP